ncbi:hypothetical protein HYV86_03130 [Candidatus Woesearchaeota archaeon]|nr:hypothetical protein [Candidatus Woesearchaeota archaeon]
MNKKGQNVGGIVEAFVAIIFLIAMIPILWKLADLSTPEPTIVVDQAAIELSKNLSEQLAICQKNYEELNSTMLTKNDIIELTGAIRQVNQNVITIYENNNNYIQNYFSFTIILSISLAITFSIGLFALLDWTVFNFELRKGLFEAIKKRFQNKKE